MWWGLGGRGVIGVQSTVLKLCTLRVKENVVQFQLFAEPDNDYYPRGILNNSTYLGIFNVTQVEKQNYLGLQKTVKS